MTDYDVNRPTSAEADTLARYAEYLLGKNLPGIQENTSKLFGLYDYFLNHLNDPPGDLQRAITEQGAPLFTEAQIRSIVKILSTQRNSRFAKRFQGQTGGGDEPVLATVPATAPATATATATATAPVSATTAPVAQEPVDKTRNKFWDKVIEKLTGPVSRSIPKCWDQYFWFLFILYNLEQIELLGPFISTALDTVTLSLPVLADMASELVEKLILLVPIPYAGIGGEAIGYAVSLIFVLFAVNLNISRKHFGDAFQVSLEAIPLFGDILAEGAQKFELGAERYLINRDKLIHGIQPVSPSAAMAMRYYSPAFDAYEGPAPPVALGTVIKDVKAYTMKTSGADKVLEAVQQGPAGLVSKATGALPTIPTGSSLVASATNAVKNATATATTTAVKNATTTAVKNATAMKNTTVANTMKNLNRVPPNTETQKGGSEGGVSTPRGSEGPESPRSKRRTLRRR